MNKTAQKNKVLVTGASGLLGVAAAERFFPLAVFNGVGNRLEP